jgi:glycerate kinase
MPGSPRLEFWCEIASTYTYLAAMRVDALAAARGVEVAWRPFSLGPIFAARGLSTSPFNVEPEKGRHMWRDLERCAAALGLPFRKPSVFPRNSIGALRVAILGVERGWGPAFVQAALRANFAEDRAIDQDGVIDELLAALGLDGKATRAEASSPEWKPRLRAQTERAREQGIFGAPTFLAGGEVFWGNDRLEAALASVARVVAAPGQADPAGPEAGPQIVSVLTNHLPRRVLVAPNAFRGSLTATEAADAIARGLRDGDPTLELELLPIADGGDGTGEVLRRALGGHVRHAQALDPLGRPREASYVVLADGTAVVEIASASGSRLVAAHERDALRASTFGTGQLLIAALDAGAREILVGLGGSATNDGGAGALQALGARFLDARGAPVPPGGEGLLDLDRIDTAGLDPRLREAAIVLVCDVDSVLLGAGGATRTYGTQKGAGPEDIERLERGLARLRDVLARDFGVEVGAMPHAGAAGGTAAGLHAVLGAPMVPGADRVLELVGFERALARCDLVVTAEGRLDATTRNDKGPLRVARAASRLGKPVLFVAGAIDPGVPRAAWPELGAIHSLCRRPMQPREAMEQAASLLAETSVEIARTLALGRRTGAH